MELRVMIFLVEREGRREVYKVIGNVDPCLPGIGEIWECNSMLGVVKCNAETAGVFIEEEKTFLGTRYIFKPLQRGRFDLLLNVMKADAGI